MRDGDKRACQSAKYTRGIYEDVWGKRNIYADFEGETNEARGDALTNKQTTLTTRWK